MEKELKLIKVFLISQFHEFKAHLICLLFYKSRLVYIKNNIFELQEIIADCMQTNNFKRVSNKEKKSKSYHSLGYNVIFNHLEDKNYEISNVEN